MENTNLTLEEHRNRTIGEILGKLQNNDRVCCVRYTGYGKTYHLIKRLMEIFSDKQFLIFVPAKSLIKRYVKLFKENNVIIKTYQSLLFMNENEIKDNFSNIDYIICDEAHRLGKNKWRQSIKNAFDIIDNGNTKIIGFTATPMRGDKIDIVGDFFNGIETSRFDLLDGIQAGYIPKIDYVVAYCDLSGLNKEIYDERMEDIDRYEIDKLLNVSEIIKENIPKNKLKENLKVVLYVSRLKDVDIAKESCYKWFTEAFPNKNIKVFSLSSEYTDKENSDYLDDYSDDEDNNSIDIMISCNKLNEGLHLPKCSIAILLRRTTSPIVYFQQIGRAINGAKPVVFDLVDNNSHVYHAAQIRNDYIEGNNDGASKNKKIFSMCVNLIDKAKDLESILYKYKFNSKLPDDIKIKIIEDAKSNRYTVAQLAEKYSTTDDTIYRIFRDIGIPIKFKNKDMNYLKSIISDNIDFINNSMGKLTQKEIAEHIGIPEWKLKRGIDLCNIDYKGIYKEFIYDSTVSQNIQKCFKEGLTYKETADRLKIKYADVRKYCRIDNINKNQKFNENQKHVMIEMYENGDSISSISKLLNITPAKVTVFLKQNNLYKPKEIKKISLEEEIYICNLYKTKGYEEISNITGYGIRRIRTIIKNHGLTGLYRNGKNKNKVIEEA